jgi:Thiopurine S-methyltransferase (TPMT).
MKETNWQERYLNQQTGWDIGEISQPLKAYFDQLTDKRMRILVPGGGNGYEAAYLHAPWF